MKSWVKVGLGWGFWMFLGMAFFWPWIDDTEIRLKKVIFQLIFWLFGGVLFGYSMRKNFKD